MYTIYKNIYVYNIYAYIDMVSKEIVAMLWLLTICPNSFIKTQNQSDIFCDADF